MRRYGQVALGIVIAVALLFLLQRDPKHVGSQRADLSASQAPEAPESPRSVEPNDAPVQAVNAPTEVPQEEKLKTYLMRQHPAAIESRLEKRDAFITRYRLLGRKKVLLSSEETQELETLLRDREMANTYQDYLQKVDFASHPIADEQMYRLFLLQYFESAYSQNKDPELLEFFLNFVLKDNFNSQLPMDVKKSLAYEKIKVLGFLKERNPESLERVKQGMSGLRHEKLLRDFFENGPAS